MQKLLPEVVHAAIEETITAFFLYDVGLTPGPTIIKPEEEPYLPPQADVTAIIGFSGVMEGGVHLSAPMHAALGLASAFSGETIETYDDMARDALGELANIVAGAVKGRISEQIYLTPPQVITGTNYTIAYTHNLASTKCYFKTVNGPFYVEVFYRKDGALFLQP